MHKKFAYLLLLVLCKTSNGQTPLRQSSIAVEPTGFVHIEPGTFKMGSNNGEADEMPTHEVSITNAFYIQDHEITVNEYQAFVDATFYRPATNCLDGVSNWDQPDKQDHPVNCVSWTDAMAYFQWLNDSQDVYFYRFPTEAEWEYVARAGSSTEYSCGDEQCLRPYAWFIINANYDSHAVKTKKKNPWNLSLLFQ